MANKGDKFIIELDSKITNHNGFLYGVKDVPGLYVNDEIIEHLDKISIKTRYASIGAWFCDLIGNSPAFIQDKGKVEEILMKIESNAMDKMWGIARKIALIDTDCKNSFSQEDIQEMFGVTTPYEVFRNFTGQEILKTIKAYEKQKDKIEVGDEIFSETTKIKAVVQRIDSWARWEVLTEKGQTVINNDEKKYWQKTGRHFPQIAEVLKEMRCEDERED